MNWKIIFQLSIFGLIMAFGTVSLIPQNIEPVFWLVIFIFCAYIIAKVCNGKYFLHGFLTSMANCIWITAVHVIYYHHYTENHPGLAAAFNNTFPRYLLVHPRQAMIYIGPFFGIASGAIFGIICLVMAKVVNRKSA